MIEQLAKQSATSSPTFPEAETGCYYNYYYQVEPDGAIAVVGREATTVQAVTVEDPWSPTTNPQISSLRFNEIPQSSYYGRDGTPVETINHDDSNDATSWTSRLRNMVILVDAINALWGLICLAFFIVGVLSFVLVRKSYMNHHPHTVDATTTDDSTSTAAAVGGTDDALYSYYRVDDDSADTTMDNTVAWTNTTTSHSTGLEEAVTSILIGFAIQIGASCIGIIGALRYNVCLTSLATVGYAVAWILNLLSCDVLGVIAATFCLGPHVAFLYVIMSRRSSQPSFCSE